MERKGGLRVGEGGLIGGSPLVSVRILASLMFPDTNSPSHLAANAIMTITDTCTYPFAIFNIPYLHTGLFLIFSTSVMVFRKIAPSH